jgi:hypothetical protein
VLSHSGIRQRTVVTSGAGKCPECTAESGGVVRLNLTFDTLGIRGHPHAPTVLTTEARAAGWSP